jgi:hypothetical protein
MNKKILVMFSLSLICFLLNHAERFNHDEGSLKVDRPGPEAPGTGLTTGIVSVNGTQSSTQSSTKKQAQSPESSSAPSKQKANDLEIQQALATSDLVLDNKASLPKPLDQFRSFQQLTLPSNKTKRELEGLVSFSESLASIHAILAATDEKFFHRDHESSRILAVDFLDQALSWSENPIRSKWIQVAVSLLSQPLSGIETQDARLRQSLAGDKIEIFKILQRHNPKLAKQLARQSHGPERKLFEYALQTN